MSLPSHRHAHYKSLECAGQYTFNETNLSFSSNDILSRSVIHSLGLSMKQIPTALFLIFSPALLIFSVCFFFFHPKYRPTTEIFRLSLHLLWGNSCYETVQCNKVNNLTAVYTIDSPIFLIMWYIRHLPTVCIYMRISELTFPPLQGCLLLCLCLCHLLSLSAASLTKQRQTILFPL